MGTFPKKIIDVKMLDFSFGGKRRGLGNPEDLFNKILAILDIGSISS